MLLKPVTAFALCAIVSIATFAASPAVAAPNVSDSSEAAPLPKSTHHVKSGKKGAAGKAKKNHLASLHSPEPKESPKLASREPAKVPASMSTPLKNVKDKSHAGVAKKATVAATGKEVFIGGPTHRSSGKVAQSTAHAKTGAMSKSGRAPSRPEGGASKEGSLDSGADDHPVPVALHTKVALSAKAPAAPCLHDPIEFVRGAETDHFAMTRCDGAAAPLALERLSVLVRPESANRPESIANLAKVEGRELAPGVRRVDPGLLTRLQAIADHFEKPGMPRRIAIVSGYRPSSAGSFHASAQALDFHLEGVANEALVEFCKTLENTGCGYYPNSSFVHVDVRPPGTGHVAWIDTSGPGEPPHYVSSWPPPPEPEVKMAKEDAENPYTNMLPELPGSGVLETDVRTPAAAATTPLKLKDWE
jgi:hypothetical protein